MKLNELTTEAFVGPGRIFDTELERIHWWMQQFDIKNYDVSSTNLINVYSGTVVISGPVLEKYKLTKLPISFGVIDGDFYVNGPLLTLEGCPTQCKRFDCSRAPKLISLKGAPMYTKSDTTLHAFSFATCGGITSLEGISDDLEAVDGKILFSPQLIRTGGIGLMLVSGITGFKYYDSQNSKPFDIIQKYLGKPDQIFDCQTELIDAGYEEYSRL